MFGKMPSPEGPAGRTRSKSRTREPRPAPGAGRKTAVPRSPPKPFFNGVSKVPIPAKDSKSRAAALKAAIEDLEEGEILELPGIDLDVVKATEAAAKKLPPGVTTEYKNIDGQLRLIEKTAVFPHTVNRHGRVYEEETISYKDITKGSKKDIGVWAVRRHIPIQRLEPGEIILAVHTAMQHDVRQPYPSDEVRVFGQNTGPVWAKLRPMVILFHTANTMMCLPIKGGVTGGRDRSKEYVSLTYKSELGWKGDAPFNGPPLLMYRRAGFLPNKHSYVDVGQPVFVNHMSAVQYNIAKLTKLSFARLLDIWRVIHNQALLKAYADNQLAMPPNVALDTLPDKNRLPNSGVSDIEIKRELR